MTNRGVENARCGKELLSDMRQNTPNFLNELFRKVMSAEQRYLTIWSTTGTGQCSQMRQINETIFCSEALTSKANQSYIDETKYADIRDQLFGFQIL